MLSCFVARSRCRAVYVFCTRQPPCVLLMNMQQKDMPRSSDSTSPNSAEPSAEPSATCKGVLIGLTGSIGAGKSTVAEWLRAQQIPQVQHAQAQQVTVLDADQVAREVTETPQTLEELSALFAGVAGASELVKDGVLDRAALARVVFGDAEKLKALNALIHPKVRARMQELTEAAWHSAQPAQSVQPVQPVIVLQDIPLLYENGLETQFDAVLVVDAELEKRIERVMKRSQLSRAEVLARDKQQYPADKKRHRADWLVTNDGNREDLTRQLEELWPKIRRWATQHARCYVQ